MIDRKKKNTDRLRKATQPKEKKPRKLPSRKERIENGTEYEISMRQQRVRESIHTLYPNENTSKMTSLGGNAEQHRQEARRAISSALNSGRSISYVIHEMFGHSSRVKKESLHPLFIDWTNLVLSIALAKGIISESEAQLLAVDENTNRDFAFPHLNKQRPQTTFAQTLGST